MTSTADREHRSINRVEGVEKVTGAAHYTVDVSLPGQVHAVLVQSEIPHGRVTDESMRSSAARASAAPGVVHVLTPQNCPPLGTVPEDLSWDLPLERRPPLSDMTVQHVGQHLALVVAETLEDATAAASLFELEYDRLPEQLNARDVAPAAAGQQGPVRQGSYQPDHFVKLSEEKLQDSRGEPPTDGAARVAPRYTTPLHPHYPIELSATVASWSADQLTVHDSTRWIAGERTALAAYLGIAEDPCECSPRWSAGPSDPRASCGCTWRCVPSPPARSDGPSSWC